MDEWTDAPMIGYGKAMETLGPAGTLGPGVYQLRKNQTIECKLNEGV